MNKERKHQTFISPLTLKLVYIYIYIYVLRPQRFKIPLLCESKVGRKEKTGESVKWLL